MGSINAIASPTHEIAWILLGLALAAAGAAAAVLWYRQGRPTRFWRMPQARRQWAQRLADSSFDGLLIHRNGIILQMNRALVRMLGYRESEMLGTSFYSLTHPTLITDLRTEMEAPQPQIVPFTLLHADKTERLVELASNTLEFDGLPATVTAIRDITPLRVLEEQLAQVTQNDGLTGLVNRQRFAKLLQEAIDVNDRSGGTTAVLCLEVDRLKAINEAFGRGGGDSLLRQIALRLSGFRHEKDVVGRLDGDKFGIIQPHTGAPNRNTSLVSQIEMSFEEPFIIDGRAVTASLSIGAAIYPEHATDAEGLLWASNLEMDRVSQAGGGGSRMFTHADAHAEVAPRTVAQANAAKLDNSVAPANFRGTMRSTQLFVREMNQAISNGEVNLDYQPYFSSKFLGVAGFEAFARWRHPKEGMIPPDKFVAMADAAGLSGTLGNFILETACTEAVRTDCPLISVNLSPLQLQDPDLPANVKEILRKTGLPPERLEVEVTEEMISVRPKQKMQTLQALREIGVGIALDDFGTGISSLSCMADFQFNKIKIEKKIVHSLDGDNNAAAILNAIMALAKNFRIEVVAEGIETEAQLNYLQDRGCQFVQGYLLGRPGPQAVCLQPTGGRPVPKPTPAPMPAPAPALTAAILQSAVKPAAIQPAPAPKASVAEPKPAKPSLVSAKR